MSTVVSTVNVGSEDRMRPAPPPRPPARGSEPDTLKTPIWIIGDHIMFFYPVFFNGIMFTLSKKRAAMADGEGRSCKVSLEINACQHCMPRPSLCVHGSQCYPGLRPPAVCECRLQLGRLCVLRLAGPSLRVRGLPSYQFSLYLLLTWGSCIHLESTLAT